MTAINLRRKLLEDILHEPDPRYQGQPLELPADKIVQQMFRTITIPEWCQAVGITFTVNKNPDPAFHSPTTIIFQTIKELPDLNPDDEL